jgi:transposase InsO family protein
MSAKKAPCIPLPKSWTKHVRSAMLHVISLAQFATVYSRSWAVDSLNGRVRLKVENDRLRQEVALLKEEVRIKDARMAQISPHRRPHYQPIERMAILELRAARGWSLEQAANTFLLAAHTISSWMKRLDEQGPDALVQLREPVNKFPDFVRYAVMRLKVLCPSMGKVKIAQTLCRAGLHLGSTTVGRILKEPPQPKPKKQSSAETVVTAKRPNHVWHVDLTVVPTGSGFWTSWLPFALPQNWPFCWWLVVVVDHFSRRIVSIGVFANHPDCRTVCAFLGRAIRDTNTAPKYIICDRDSIFDCDAFRTWVEGKEIEPPRYGAVGQHGSIAVVERLIRTIKDEATRRILVSERREAFRREILSYIDWYNEHRPHTTLAGRTPNEVYFKRYAAHRKPRIEPRTRWPRPSPCAKPQTLVAGQPGDQFTISIEAYRGCKHLPVVTLRRAA